MFTYKLDLPIKQETVNLNELTNREFLNIIKYIDNRDDTGLMNYFEKLIEERGCHNLTIVDKFLILLELRAKCIGNAVEMQVNGKSVSIMLNSIIENIQKVNNQVFDDLTINLIDECIMIKFNYPKSFKTTSANLLEECVSSVYIEGDEVFGCSATLIKQILDEVPVNKLGDWSFENFIEKVTSYTQEIKLIAKNTHTGLEETTFNVFGDVLFQFLKAIYNSSLANFYDGEYILISKIGITDTMNRTPYELRTFLDLYRRDIKRQEESLKS